VNELSILQYAGIFLTCWATGYSISYKILTFKKLADEVSS